MTRYYAAAIQTDFSAPASRDGIAANVERMLQIAQQTMQGYEPFFDLRLLTFPEFAHSPPIYADVETLAKKLAVSFPNEHSDRYAEFACKHKCYLQTGTFLECDSRYPGHVFNTTLLIGPNGVLARYRKVNPWLPWEVHSSPMDIPDYEDELFPVVATEIGTLAVAICYDWLFPEVLRQLSSQGAEVLIRLSAYMDPWGCAEPMDWWTTVNRCRALENCAYVVAVNQGASLEHYPPFSWPGGSMVVDYDGRILAQAEPGGGERVVVAPIDIEALRYERKRRLGHDTLAHLRSEAYNYLSKPYLPSAAGIPPDPASIRTRIGRGKERSR